MGIIVLNQEGFKELSKYSGNPFLDAMVDLQGVFNTIAAYQKHKPYIDKYSDTSLSDLKDKIKAYLPEVLDENGNINFSKLEELAVDGNKLAEAVLGIKQIRENFANAPIGGKLATFKDQSMLDVLSGNILTKQAAILKKSQKFDEVLKKLPEPIRTFLSYNKEAFLDKPELLAAIATMYGNTLGENTETQTKTQTEINQNSEENIFSVPPIQSIQSMFDEKTNEILQSLTPNTSLSTSEKKKQVINKLKQYVNKKKSQKQQQQPTNKQQQQPTNKQQQQPTNKQQQQPTNKQQQSLNSDIVFPWQNINLPILPYENLLPKTTRLW
jgi:hypothetical protein